MNRRLISLATSALVMIGAVGVSSYITQPAYAQESDEQVNIRVYKIASPAVVSIKAGKATGSGTIIDAKGLVLTNAHVVRGTTTVTVILANKQELQGTVIASSRNNPDLAMIRLNGVTGSLPTISLSSSPQIQVGQRAFAIGDPFGRFAGTLTTGIISRIDLDRKTIQTDAAINPGNSGGPLLNSKGELIGVNSNQISSSGREGNIGINFAIDVSSVQEFVTAVQQGRIGVNNAAPVATKIVLNGVPITGTLTSADETLSDGSFFKVFQFEGRAGQKVVIDMRSTEIDPYLVLFDPRSNKIAEDDDSAGDSNARISTTLPTTGTYTFYTNSYEVGDAGSFTLNAKAVNPNPNTAAISAANQPVLRVGAVLQRNGTLGDGSNVLARDGSLFETFSFMGRAGQVVQITLSSNEFHPYLVIFAPDRKILKEDNGLPSGKNAAITLRLPSTGTYRVVANAYDKSGRGTYRLVVRGVK